MITNLNKKKEQEKFEKLGFSTPMMQQYLEIKKQYADCLLLFRLGDFYELFLDDAKIGAEVLGITLTSRSRGRDGSIPMCGIPYHALDSYLGKLIKAGFKVAICEQVEEASITTEMVKREVVRVVTPGTILDEKNLIQKENNFILALEIEKKNLGLAYADLSTGELYLNQLKFKNLEQDLAGEISRIKPAEIISSHKNYNSPAILKALRVNPTANIYPYDNWEKEAQNYNERLKGHFQVVTWEGFGIKLEKHVVSLKAAAALLSYLKETQKSALKHIHKMTPTRTDKYLHLDASTIANLELFSTLREQGKTGTLVNVLDHTHTAAGGRKLRQFLLSPLRQKNEINQRLDAIGILKLKMKQREKIQNFLSEVLDLERLISRVSVGTANPRDLIGLKVSLINIKKIANYLEQELQDLSYLLPDNLLEKSKPLVKLLEQNLKPDPPATLSDGGYMADSISTQLDEFREIVNGSTNWLKNFEQKEKKRTGIENLKVRRNKVFGFYIEVSKSNIGRVPPDYIRKQTLINAERYIIPELKAREEAALQAEENIKVLEKELFDKLLIEVLNFATFVQEISQKTASLDVFCSLAQVAQENRYVRPELTEKEDLIIESGRHPVIERLQGKTAFVPNDVHLNNKDSQILIITGPNMAGKSTYLRQTALITLLAQIGSFVPASKATIPIRDQIFTRVGAVDNISLGQSTFLVEMIETANILYNCTNKSLIIFDEIGRGTSTFDGMSLAWAVVEYLLKNKKQAALTLFATHYHELTNLSKKYPQLKNLQVAVKREGEEIVFLHKVIEGSTWQSYGIEVARLAGLPKSVVKRAQQILLKVKSEQKNITAGKRTFEEATKQTALFESD